MKHLSKRHFLKMGMALIAIAGCIASFAVSNSAQRHAYSTTNFSGLAKVLNANADCNESKLCGGSGSGCTIEIDGNTFTSFVCKN
jgi:hypothetical protein